MYDHENLLRRFITWPTDNSTTLPPPGAPPSGAAAVAAGMVSRAAESIEPLSSQIVLKSVT
jgi:hypothetical protein